MEDDPITSSWTSRLTCFSLLGLSLLSGCAHLYDPIDASLTCVHCEVEAAKTWHYKSRDFCQVNYPHHFGAGFRAGYVNVCRGGDGCSPTLPPKTYWTIWYRNAAGQAKTVEWFNGFSAGAAAAMQAGHQQFGQLVTSGDAGVGCNCDQREQLEYDLSDFHFEASPDRRESYERQPTPALSARPQSLEACPSSEPRLPHPPVHPAFPNNNQQWPTPPARTMSPNGSPQPNGQPPNFGHSVPTPNPTTYPSMSPNAYFGDSNGGMSPVSPPPPLRTVEPPPPFGHSTSSAAKKDGVTTNVPQPMERPSPESFNNTRSLGNDRRGDDVPSKDDARRNSVDESPTIELPPDNFPPLEDRFLPRPNQRPLPSLEGSASQTSHSRSRLPEFGIILPASYSTH